MTLTVLAIDALDHQLLDLFDSEVVRLNSDAPLEMFTYSLDAPHTMEVWPTIATGTHPRTHGISRETKSTWNNPLVEAGATAIRKMPKPVQTHLGDIADSTLGTSWELNETDTPSFLDGKNREVHNWPGVVNTHVLKNRWDTLETAAINLESPRSTFDRDVLATGNSKLMWAQEMLQHDADLVEVHVHAIDLAGHAYGTHESHYEQFYEWLDERVRQVVEAMDATDDLVILSDHGMGVSSVDGQESAGEHSMRAFVSTTIDGSLPDTVFDVKSWIEPHISSFHPTDGASVTVPEERLQRLGYIE
jgi:predicted AlkP superfamily pyrophosphatase or phosphodiesterase